MGIVLNFPNFACETSEVWQPVGKNLDQTVGFCDWISCYQNHGVTDLPKFSDGCFITVDQHGEYISSVLKRQKIIGSHDSAIMIRCDGTTVEFSGNVSKFDRPDNVFGFTFEQCIIRINRIIGSLGLPPFTDGSRSVINTSNGIHSEWSGCRVTRLDVTQNFATGSKENAGYFMRFLQGQQASRIKTGTYGDGETVDFGRGSRRLYFKVYAKAAELRRRGSTDYHTKLADWADSIGLVRAELTLKPLKLKDLGCYYLGGFNMKAAQNEFIDKCSVFTRADAEVTEQPKVSKSVLGTLRMWESGDNLTSMLSVSTFRRHRLQLLPYGIDIAVRSSVGRLPTRTRVISLDHAIAPNFYNFEGFSHENYN